mgnify:CR=1 FL=1
MPETERYKFFSHTACEFYPCHDMPEGELNCLFCFCRCIAWVANAGATSATWASGGDIKDCSACTVPHRRENYDYIMAQFERVKAIASEQRG